MENKVVTKIKICGMRTEDDIRAVNAAGPDCIGFIFDPSRRRYIVSEKAEQLRQMLTPGIRSAGVFVNASVSEILSVLSICPVDYIQLHGDESDSFIDALRNALEQSKQDRRTDTIISLDDSAQKDRKLFGAPEQDETLEQTGNLKQENKPMSAEEPDAISRDRIYIVKAFSIKTQKDLDRAAASHADLVLLDHGRGGTGEQFDWRLLQNFLRKYVLAGGLGPDNVAGAIRQLHPYAVDASSSLETDGRKDYEKVLKFVESVRRADEV